MENSYGNAHLNNYSVDLSPGNMNTIGNLKNEYQSMNVTMNHDANGGKLMHSNSMKENLASK